MPRQINKMNAEKKRREAVAKKLNLLEIRELKDHNYSNKYLSINSMTYGAYKTTKKKTQKKGRQSNKSNKKRISHPPSQAIKNVDDSIGIKITKVWSVKSKSKKAEKIDMKHNETNRNILHVDAESSTDRNDRTLTDKTIKSEALEAIEIEDSDGDIEIYDGDFHINSEHTFPKEEAPVTHMDLTGETVAFDLNLQYKESTTNHRTSNIKEKIMPQSSECTRIVHSNDNMKDAQLHSINSPEISTLRENLSQQNKQNIFNIKEEMVSNTLDLTSDDNIEMHTGSAYMNNIQCENDDQSVVAGQITALKNNQQKQTNACRIQRVLDNAGLLKAKTHQKDETHNKKEYATYGALLAAKLRKLDEENRLYAMNQMDNFLYELKSLF